MPPLYLPYLNIALDIFGLVVILIIFFGSMSERLGKGESQRVFFVLLPFVMVALVADTVAWICEGYTELNSVIVVSNTVAYCMGYLVIAFFMRYLKDNLCQDSKSASVMVKVFGALAVLSSAIVVFSACEGHGYVVDTHGHYVHANDFSTALTYLSFPTLSFFAIIFISAFAKNASPAKKMAFIIYTVFPVAGVIIDYTIHGISLTYIGLVVSTLIVYTNIHVKNQRRMAAQTNALMLSQINPHFIYNTLSTIAAMCEISPKRAKQLTVNFASYLRGNIRTLTSDELITFDEELKHVECYLGIERERFGERLRVAYTIGCKDFYLPPLTVQPLVENAVKHGITKKAEGGLVRITTYDTDKYYVIEVKDNGVGFDAERAQAGGDHVGLLNVRQRIYDVCRGQMTVKSTVGVGTRVIVEIPKKKVKK